MRTRTEGVSVFAPSGGLVIDNQTRRKKMVFDGRMESAAANPDEICVWCCSHAFTDEDVRRFNAVAYIEILEPATFCARVTATLLQRKARFPGRPGHERIGRRVAYYAVEDDCNPRWALPDFIATSKLRGFEWQKEFRLVFSLTDALAFQNVSMQLVRGAPQRKPSRPAIEYPFHDVQLVSGLEDLCRLRVPR